MRVNRKVSIWKHVRLADGKWRYCRPVLDAKGKIVSDMVMVKGREERHAEGNYVISFYNPKLTWQKCGRKPADVGRPFCRRPAHPAQRPASRTMRLSSSCEGLALQFP
jgi:hypothetical protein